MEAQDLERVREQAEAVNARAFPEQVEVAYHALALAMHAAQSLGDVQGLQAIWATADLQARALADRAQTTDSNALLANAMVSHMRIFASLAQQAKTTAIRLSLPGHISHGVGSDR